MVETTAWEGRDFCETAAGTAGHDGKNKKPRQPYQWPLSWHHADAAP